MLQAIQYWLRGRRYRVGGTVSRFVAMDVRRDVEIVATDRLKDGFITARMRTTNVLYQMRGLAPESEFEPPKEIALVDLWVWTGQSWGGLSDGTSLVATHHASKTDK